MHVGVRANDVMDKVKALVRDMIRKLEQEATQEPDHKAAGNPERAGRLAELAKDVDNQGKRIVSLENKLIGIGTELSTVGQELVDVNEYLEKLVNACEDKPEPGRRQEAT